MSGLNDSNLNEQSQISSSLGGNGQRAEATAEILKALTISWNGGGDQ